MSNVPHDGYVSSPFQSANSCQSSCDTITSDHPVESSRFTKLSDLLQKEESNSVINDPLVVTETEILLAVVKLSNVNYLSQTLTADILKMLNNFLGSKQFPGSRYLVDKIFNSNDSLIYHALCPKCHGHVKRFDRQDRHVKCTLCDILINLKCPTYTEFFVIANIEEELRDVLQENSSSFLKVLETRLQETDTFRDIVDGLMYKDFLRSLPEEDQSNCATLTINTDGAAVFESSTFSVWPIQAIVNELHFDIRTSKPLVCGLHFGKSKPDMNIYLDHFVDQMKKLSDIGVTCTLDKEIRIIKIFTVCCCVDSGARPAMQGMIQYNGYYGCPWCLHEGVNVETAPGRGCVKYPLTDELPMKRTEEQTLQHMRQSLYSRNPIFGVKRPSALINLTGLNIIDGFVPDRLHLLDEGLGEQFMNYWDSSGNPYSLSSDEINCINNCIKSIKVPHQLQRLTRPIDERKWWKAKEYENWILVYSIPILLSFPRWREYAEHWMLLVGAYYILLKDSITTAELITAHRLLLKFMKDTERLYLIAAITFNLQQLFHLVQSVVNWGPLFSHSTYCFENGNGMIVKMIHAAKGVIHQICRSLAMRQSEALLKKHSRISGN